MNKDFSREIRSIRRRVERKADREAKPILDAYKRSLDRVRNEIAGIYMRYSKDGELKIGKQQRYAVLKRLERRLVDQARELADINIGHTTKILEGVYEESFVVTAKTIQKGVDVAIDFSILKPEFVKAAIEMPIKGEMFSDRIWYNKEKLVRRLRDEIEKGMVKGDSIDKMARRIKNEFGTSAYESKRLIRTETARCMTQAQEEVYQNSGVVEKVLFDATLDERTSEICQSYDGQVFDLKANHPKPPLHPNCRSCIVPLVEGWNYKNRKKTTYKKLCK